MKTISYSASFASLHLSEVKPCKALILLLFLSSFLPSFAVKKIEANPLCIAVALTEQVDTASLAKTLAFYGYQPVEGNSASSASASPSPLRGQTASSDTPYLTYTHPNGTQIRYTITTTEGRFYPPVEVKSSLSQTSKEDTLKDLRFEKNGNHYERRSQTHLTRCSIGSNGTITVSCHPKPTKPYYN